MLDLVKLKEFFGSESWTKVRILFFEQTNDLGTFFFSKLIVRGFASLFVNERRNAKGHNRVFESRHMTNGEAQQFGGMRSFDLFANESLQNIMAVNVFL